METEEEEQLRIARNKTWDFYTKLIIAGAIIWNVIMFIVVYLWQDGADRCYDKTIDLIVRRSAQLKPRRV